MADDEEVRDPNTGLTLAEAEADRLEKKAARAVGRNRNRKRVRTAAFCGVVVCARAGIPCVLLGRAPLQSRAGGGAKLPVCRPTDKAVRVG